MRNSKLYGLHLQFGIITMFILVLEASALVLQVTLTDPGLTVHTISLFKSLFSPLILMSGLTKGLFFVTACY